jgi:thiol-disulfide isomerase/thioredoxin
MNLVSNHEPAGKIHARFYTRANCSLCERAYPMVERLAREGLLSVEKIDITTDPALFELYRYRIPVVVLSTGEVHEGRISPFRLRRSIARIEHG